MADFGTLLGADWSVDRSTKKIAYIGDDHGGASPSYATVIDLHRWLQARAWEAVATGDDELDITNQDPSRRSTDNIITLINGYTLDETAGTPASEHLYDGSIIQAGGDTIWDGVVNFGNSGVVIQVLQDGAVISDDWWNLASGVGANEDTAQGISHRFMVKTREDGVDIDGRRLIGTTREMDTGAGTDHWTYAEFKINGTARGNNVLALVASDDLNNSTSETTISGWTDISWSPGLNLIDIDADGTDEEYFNKFDTSGTRTQNEYYEYAKWLTRDSSASELYGVNGEVLRGITHSLAWDAETGSAVGTITNAAAVYYIWGTNVVFNTGVGTFTIGEAVHEDTATPTWKGRVLAYTGAGATGSLIIDVTDGTVTTGDTFTGQSSSATAAANGTPTVVTGGGVLLALALDDDTGSGNLYCQVLKGTISGDNALLYYGNDTLSAISVANYLTQAGAATERTISTPWIGQSTGSNIIGAYGVGFETDQVNDGDTLTALDGNQYSRPNLVTNSVGGLTTTTDQEDYVFVTTWDTVTDGGGGAGYDINGDPLVLKGQLSLSGNLTTADVSSITVTDGTETAIPSDTPSTGWIRVTDDDGYERWLPYSSWTGTTFTINTSDPDLGSNNDFNGAQGSGTYQATSGNDVYITYLDKSAASATESFQVTFSSTRQLVALVRNGGTSPIKQFIAEWSITSSNQTLNAIRTTDV